MQGLQRSSGEMRNLKIGTAIPGLPLTDYCGSGKRENLRQWPLFQWQSASCVALAQSLFSVIHENAPVFFHVVGRFPRGAVVRPGEAWQ